MPNVALCNDCDTGRDHHHWSDDDGVTQHCAMPVDGDNSSCDCASILPLNSVSCDWCGEALTEHDNDCKIVLRKALTAAEAKSDALYGADKYTLDRQQTDGDFGYVAGWGTETFYRLVRAEAAFLGEEVAAVEARRREQRWKYEPRVVELLHRIEIMEMAR